MGGGGGGGGRAGAVRARLPVMEDKNLKNLLTCDNDSYCMCPSIVFWSCIHGLIKDFDVKAAS